MGGKSQRDGTIFMGEIDPSRHNVKILIWIKWLKNGAGKCLLFLHCIIFGENFIG